MGGWWSSFRGAGRYFRLSYWSGSAVASTPAISDYTPDAPLSLTMIVIGLDGAGKTTLFRSIMFDPDKQRPNLLSGASEGANPGPAVTVVPTVSFNVESGRVGAHQVHMWDLGGQERLRPLWDHYFHTGLDALIFVVDGCDRDRLVTARTELERALRFESVVRTRRSASSWLIGDTDAVVQILINKADLGEACITAEQLSDLWDVPGLMRSAVLRFAAPESPLQPSAVHVTASSMMSSPKYALDADPRCVCHMWEIRSISAATGLGVDGALSWLTSTCEKAARLKAQ